MSGPESVRAAPVDPFEILSADNAGLGAPELVISGLVQKMAELGLDQQLRLKEYLAAPLDSAEERAAEEQFFAYNLVLAAAEVAKANTHNDLTERNFWSRWCTYASLARYGGPDPEAARRSLEAEVTTLQRLQDDSRISQPDVRLLLETYAPILEALPPAEPPEEAEGLPMTSEQEVLRGYDEAIRKLFPGFFEIIDAATESKQLLTPNELLALSNKLFNHLATNDPSWRHQNWKAVMVKKRALFATDPDTCRLLIGENRVPVPVGMVAGLTGHEILGHAMAAKNGRKVGDNALAGKVGWAFPGSDVVEEGRQSGLEAAITGRRPDKIIHRELDIVLALGTLDDIRRNRPVLFDISHARHRIFAEQQAASQEEIANVEATTWQHVDRIYAPGTGDDKGEPAILTRDIVYPQGYHNAIRLMADLMAAGVTGKQLYWFFSHGIFDAADPEQVQHVMDVYGYTDPRQLYTEPGRQAQSHAEL